MNKINNLSNSITQSLSFSNLNKCDPMHSQLGMGQRRASEDRAAIVITKRFCRIVTEKDFFLVASTEWGKNKLVAHSSIC